MVIPAALQADAPSDAEIGITAETLTTWRKRALLWQREDRGRRLAFFTSVADVTTRAPDCRFAGDDRVLVARRDGLPFIAVAFCPAKASIPEDGTIGSGDVSKLLVSLNRCLVAHDGLSFPRVDESDWPILEAAYEVVDKGFGPSPAYAGIRLR